MKKSSDENIAFPRVRNFPRLWSEVAQSTFPFMREEFGELDEMDRLFVTVCESVAYASASLHDSQVMIPLVKKASERMEHGFDLADAAYDAEAIREASAEEGNVPVIAVEQTMRLLC